MHEGDGVEALSSRFGALAEGGAEADEAEADEDAGDDDIKGEVAMDAESEYLFKDTAKLSVFAPDKPKKWEERGQGVFTIRRSKASETGAKAADPFAVFTTETGRILVSARLHPGPVPAKEGKRKVQLRFPLMFSKGEGQPVQPHNVLLAASNESQADALIGVLEQHMPSPAGH
ncbi:hypothetical protein WJX74_002707 [Apatococcus lobatus]|uniref:RanBD1 domain-containing protein n=1 Tax=Apatococcus lobatus TaxID=904363 RepID=A0AAW1S367_9CHLO